MSRDLIVAEVDPEMEVRWTQWTASLPLMRFHGVRAREPTAYSEPAHGAAIAADSLESDCRTMLSEAHASLRRPIYR
jgi:alpha-D-xyloside xylohydrolase